MKEASGELNMTAITVVAIGAIGVFFYTLIWPAIRNSIETRTRCSSAVCGPCAENRTAQCQYLETAEDGTTESVELTCPCNQRTGN